MSRGPQRCTAALLLDLAVSTSLCIERSSSAATSHSSLNRLTVHCRDLFGRVSLGDIVVSFNGKQLAKQGDFYAALDQCQVGDTVELTLAPRSKETWQSRGLGGMTASGAAAAAASAANGPQGRRVRAVLADRKKMQWRAD